MTDKLMLSRRQLLKTSAAGAAIGLASSVLPLRAAFAASATVGFIYVGPKDDYGYNQAHAEGAAALKGCRASPSSRKKMSPRPSTSRRRWKSMINLDGATLVFPTSFGYFDPHMLAMSAKYPGRAVPPLRRPVDRGQAPDERRHLLWLYRRGPISERRRRRPCHASPRSSASSRPSRSRRCCATSIRFTARCALGRSDDHHARSSSPATGRWPVKEAEATNALIDQGVDVITCHVDSPKVVVETAEAAASSSAATTPTRPARARRAI